MDKFITEVIKKHPGPQQVDRAVVVKVPGKHFPQLQLAEPAVFYDGQAVEYAERHKFSAHHAPVPAGARTRTASIFHFFHSSHMHMHWAIPPHPRPLPVYLGC